MKSGERFLMTEKELVLNFGRNRLPVGNFHFDYKGVKVFCLGHNPKNKTAHLQVK